jgi:uncharacterized protein DUF3572
LLAAETVGLKALSFLAAEPETLDRFLTASGADPSMLRHEAEAAHVLAAVLEFLLGNEPLLIRFCESEAIDARAVHLAAARLGN